MRCRCRACRVGVARFFQENREEVLITSTAALAVKAGTSDATIVRATKSLSPTGVYSEPAVLIDQVDRHGVKSLLLTDTLAAKLRHRVNLILPVSRGRADMLSMYTATLGLIETLRVGVAPRFLKLFASLNARK